MKIMICKVIIVVSSNNTWTDHEDSGDIDRHTGTDDGQYSQEGIR